MNKKELLDKVKSLDGLSTEEKAYLINLVNTKKKYGLVWEDKPEDVEEQLRTHLPVLKEVKERAIINDTKTEKHPNHILIEGDNLEALTSLNFTHDSKIDFIYIDPPYNTGNKDFRYNDNIIDKEDSFRHSKWLSFMSRRLHLAKQLLKTEGVIFISIDDNELAQLKMLCDEIFFEENFIEYFSWTKTSTPPGLSKKSRKTVEYILCYEKRKSNNKYQGDLISGGDAPLLNTGNNKRDITFPKDKIIFKIPDGEYNAGTYFRVELINDIIIKDGKPNKDVILNGEFKWTQATTNREINEGTYFLIKSEKFSIRFQRANINTYKSPTNHLREDIYSSKINKKEQGVDTNEQASAEITQILGKPFFDYPKPVSLIKYLIDFFPQKDLKILDFFAGSGTTLHATMMLNSEDDGKRECILVTNNENKIAEEITYERNKKVINGYKDNKDKEVSGLTNNNLRYYQTNILERKTSLSNKRKLTQLSTELLCIKENCYTEVTSQLENASWHKFFTNGTGNYVYVIYDDMYIEDGVSHLSSYIEQNPEAQIKVYVFANGPYPYTEEFENIAGNIELAALPDAIYKAYQNILPKQNKEFVPELEEESPVEFDQ